MSKSNVELQGLVLQHYFNSCKIPIEWRQMITEIVTANMRAISTACGNLEMAYRRTLMHTKEAREKDPMLLKK